MALRFDTPINKLPGVGPVREKKLAKLGIVDVKSLLYHFPKAYRDKGDVCLLRDAESGEVRSFILTVSDIPRTVRIKGGMSITKFRAFDESGSCTVSYFNQCYLDKVFTMGSEYRFYGKLNKTGRGTELSSPEYEPLYEGVELPPLSPLYSVCEGVSQKVLKGLICYAIDNIGVDGCSEILPEELRKKQHLPGIISALRVIHKPLDFESLEKARKRFIFEELFVYAAGTVSNADNMSREKAPLMEIPDMRPFYSALPFCPTGAQTRSINEIFSDMNNSSEAMSRLVSGDVGSGKTLCAAAAVYMCVKNGYQAALMVPTEILAVQHYNDLSELLGKFGMKTELLTSTCKAAEKRRIIEELAAGNTDLVIGTHALLNEKVEFKKLGLVITDEQHRFGVMQRAKLSEKSHGVHTLVMSATPIPRTLSLILYGDLDISAVDEMPPGRQRVDTFVVDSTYRERLHNFIRKQVNDGSQVYIVCPAIETAEKDEELDGERVINFTDMEKQAEKPKLVSAVDYYRELCEEIFPDLRVGLVHGKQKADQKDRIMSEFSAGNIDILVSTTVIEVGVNVPNATLMIVENAERFGLSQLHQLRGRVGRGNKKAYCVLISDAVGDTSKERLATMRDNYDGYKIAQKDLEMRGPGDFLPGHDGTARQSGSSTFKYANLCSDMEALKEAFDWAKQICRSEKWNSADEYTELKAEVNRVFETNRSVMN